MLILLSPPLFLSFSVMCFPFWGSFSGFSLTHALAAIFQLIPRISECLLLLCCLSSSPRIWALWDLCWMASLQVRALLSPACGLTQQTGVYGPQELLTSGFRLAFLVGEHRQEPRGSGESAFRAFVSLAPSLGESLQDGCVLDWKSQVLPSGLSTNFPGCTNYFHPPQALCWSLWPSFVIPLCPADTLNYPCLKSSQLKKKSNKVSSGLPWWFSG